MPGVGLEAGGPSRLVACLHRLQVAAERDLRVDDDVLAPDEAHDQVRPDAAVLTRGRGLGDVVDVLGQAGRLDRAFELQLAPPPTDLGCAQGGCCTRSSDSRSGATRPSIACWRWARAPSAAVSAVASLASASRTNASLLRRSASPASEPNVSRSWSSVRA